MNHHASFLVLSVFLWLYFRDKSHYVAYSDLKPLSKSPVLGIPSDKEAHAIILHPKYCGFKFIYFRFCVYICTYLCVCMCTYMCGGVCMCIYIHVFSLGAVYLVVLRQGLKTLAYGSLIKLS